MCLGHPLGLQPACMARKGGLKVKGVCWVSTSVLKHLRQGRCALSLSFLIWRIGMTPRPKTKAWGGLPGPRTWAGCCLWGCRKVSGFSV